jgi:hypothetical protein
MAEFQQGQGATSLITVSSAGFTRLVTVSDCQKVTIGEDPSISGWPTTDYLIARPLITSQPRRVTGGNVYPFTPPYGMFKPGQTIGFVKATTGTTTFFQDEQ